MVQGQVPRALSGQRSFSGWFSLDSPLVSLVTLARDTKLQMQPQSHGHDTAEDGDDFGSVAWETAPTAAPAAAQEPFAASQGDVQDLTQYSSLGHDYQSDPTSIVASSSQADPHPSLANTPVHSAQVKDGKVELEGTSETFVSYLVTAKVSFCHCSTAAATHASLYPLPISQTDLPIYASKTPSSRRRFQDFVFMRDLLTRDFPACVVPPLPDKHRMGSSRHSSAALLLIDEICRVNRIRCRRSL